MTDPCKPQAGRLPNFDALASKFFTAVDDVKKSVVEEAKALLASNASESAQYYFRVMEKQLNGPAGYLEKELNRWVAPCTSLCSSSDRAPTSSHIQRYHQRTRVIPLSFHQAGVVAEEAEPFAIQT